MDAPPALEVAADTVHWDWDGRWPVIGQHDGVNGPATIAAAISQVSIRTAHLQMHCAGEPDDSAGTGPFCSLTPEEALSRILRYAAPGMRSCLLGATAPVDATGRRDWRLELVVIDASPKRQTSVYRSAAELLEGLQPHAAAAQVRLQLDEGRQAVLLTRREAD